MSNPLYSFYLIAGDILAPLRRNFSSLESLEYVCYQYGWEVNFSEIVNEKIDSIEKIQQVLQDFFGVMDVISEKRSKKEEIRSSDYLEIGHKTAVIVKLLSFA